MRFKLDENLPLSSIKILKDNGHDVHTVLGQGLGGKPDNLIFDIVRSEGFIFITLDLDFSDIRTYHPESNSGIIILRLHHLSCKSIHQTMHEISSLVERHTPYGHIWIIDEDKIRIRDFRMGL